MISKNVALDLTKDLKGIIWFNLLFIAVAVTFSLTPIYGDLFIALICGALMAALMGMVSNMLLRRFYMPKAEERLSESFKELRESMSFDELTGVYNRRAGMTRLREEFARAGRGGEHLTVAMIDADNFKFLNDTYGHQAGDQVLRTIAGTMNTWLREEDIVFRFGGEEFMVIMPDTKESDAFHPLDRMREKLSEDVVSFEGHQIKTSVSIGVATVSVRDRDESAVIGRADKALYSAKSSGRNRVVYDDMVDVITEPPLMEANM